MPHDRATMESDLRRLCDETARMHGLTRDQADELFTHMQDKASAYMSGGESLSDEDVVLLVREHFGSREALRAMVGAGAPTPGAFNALTRLWPKRRSTDFWGTIYFPWLNENRVLFPVGMLLVFEAVFVGVLLILQITLRGKHFAPVVYVLPPLIGPLVAGLYLVVYLCVAGKVKARRALVRQSPDFESEGIVVHGMTESPAIIQSIDNEIVITPVLGEQLTITLSDLEKVQERHFYNGTAYWGDNAAFSLDVRGHDERIGFVVPRPALWRRVFGLSSSG